MSNAPPHSKPIRPQSGPAQGRSSDIGQNNNFQRPLPPPHAPPIRNEPHQHVKSATEKPAATGPSAAQARSEERTITARPGPPQSVPPGFVSRFSNASKAASTDSSKSKPIQPPNLKRENCGHTICEMEMKEKRSMWEHAKACKRPKVCGVQLCEKLQQTETDDLQEAFGKLQRDIHPPPVIPEAKRAYRAMPVFPLVDIDFRKRDRDFFGSDHIPSNATVLMTGVYYPQLKCLGGVWTFHQPQSAQKGVGPRFFPVKYICSDEDLVDTERSEACDICKSADDSKSVFVVCDLCDRPFHIRCVKLPSVPENEYYCTKCADIKQKLGNDLPPTRDWLGEFDFLDVKTKSLQTTSDHLRLVFDYSNASGNVLSTISGYGKSAFGPYKVTGVLRKCTGQYLFQLAKFSSTGTTTATTTTSTKGLI